MSTSAVSVNPNQSSYIQYLQQRQSDLHQLGQDLQNGDLSDAQTEYNTIESLGQSGPFANGDAFSLSNRQQDFNALGQALQSGDLTQAQQAFTQLQDTFRQSSTSSSSGNPSNGSSSGPGGAEIVLNLANAPSGEQITINLTNGSNGTEQVAISATNPDDSNPEQIAFNLNPSSNQEIVLNLFGNSTTQGNSSASNSTTNLSA
jgi:hypothetical protein